MATKKKAELGIMWDRGYRKKENYMKFNEKAGWIQLIFHYKAKKKNQKSNKLLKNNLSTFVYLPS